MCNRELNKCEIDSNRHKKITSLSCEKHLKEETIRNKTIQMVCAHFSIVLVYFPGTTPTNMVKLSKLWHYLHEIIKIVTDLAIRFALNEAKLLAESSAVFCSQFLRKAPN